MDNNVEPAKSGITETAQTFQVPSMVVKVSDITAEGENNERRLAVATQILSAYIIGEATIIAGEISGYKQMPQGAMIDKAIQDTDVLIAKIFQPNTAEKVNSTPAK